MILLWPSCSLQHQISALANVSSAGNCSEAHFTYIDVNYTPSRFMMHNFCILQNLKPLLLVFCVSSEQESVTILQISTVYCNLLLVLLSNTCSPIFSHNFRSSSTMDECTEDLNGISVNRLHEGTVAALGQAGKWCRQWHAQLCVLNWLWKSC